MDDGNHSNSEFEITKIAETEQPLYRPDFVECQRLCPKISNCFITCLFNDFLSYESRRKSLLLKMQN